MEGPLLFLLLLLWKLSDAERCSVAQRQCMAQLGCGLAWHNFMTSCGNLLHNKTVNECHPSCRKAMTSLLMSASGSDFLTCDCDGNQFCRRQKLRMDICQSAVRAAMLKLDDPEAVVSCSLATMVCKADTSCQTAMEYYDTNCVKMFRGERCTARCHNSLDVLYRQPKAAKLRNCRCDGSSGFRRSQAARREKGGGFTCEIVQRRTQELCFARKRHQQRYKHQKQTTTPARKSAENGSGFLLGSITMVTVTMTIVLRFTIV
ncbi:hypothetical protein CAPTEDRAFT_209088 [Capitella teleta]|uniref:GDNF/GAS1 domain-containing protein n=1 Tax=Capitella teleta TaxID=283909 RepID=R7US30_CAPTE|nr:hypothetical protein CAPTEDRAFT_209088 [Capitella teleta]|eukprot:ELU06717.1 hypothetical protein CAPTEDRAFT_209088 [Capitella teleta]